MYAISVIQSNKPPISMSSSGSGAFSTTFGASTTFAAATTGAWVWAPPLPREIQDLSYPFEDLTKAAANPLVNLIPACNL